MHPALGTAPAAATAIGRQRPGTIFGMRASRIQPRMSRDRLRFHLARPSPGSVVFIEPTLEQIENILWHYKELNGIYFKNSNDCSVHGEAKARICNWVTECDSARCRIRSATLGSERYGATQTVIRPSCMQSDPFAKPGPYPCPPCFESRPTRIFRPDTNSSWLRSRPCRFLAGGNNSSWTHCSVRARRAWRW
jgi:hypothetical protein